MSIFDGWREIERIKNRQRERERREEGQAIVWEEGYKRISESEHAREEEEFWAEREKKHAAAEKTGRGEQ